MTLGDEILKLLDVGNCATKSPLAVSSLQVGIYAALKSFGVGRGTTVLCDPVFPYATLAALHAGARPGFPRLGDDVVPTAEAWRNAWQPHVGAAVATVVFGHNSLTSSPASDGLTCPVILDCAFAPFARQSDHAEEVDVTGYSFATGKPLSCGEGGLLLFRDPRARERALRWSRFGVGDDADNPEQVPGLNFCISPALLPVLRASRARLFDVLQRLSDSWEEVEATRPLPEHTRYFADRIGWFHAFLTVRDDDARRFPVTVEANGIGWKRCHLKSSATTLVAGVAEETREAAESIVRRLLWYRPVLDEPWGQAAR